MAAETGQASGWTSYKDPQGPGWKWTAYGPAGSETGEADSKQGAERAARAAQDRLREAPGG